MKRLIPTLLSLGLLAYLVFVAVASASTSICTEGTCTGSSSNVMVGTPVDDQIWGDDHANTLKGKKAADRLWGYGNADTLEGGNGDDWLKGGAGEDLLSGLAGDDTINARESGTQRTDYVFCGWGFDTVLTVKGGVDWIDPDCEKSSDVTRVEVKTRYSDIDALTIYGPYAKGRTGIRTQLRYEDDGLVVFEIVCEHEIDLDENCKDCERVIS